MRYSKQGISSIDIPPIRMDGPFLKIGNSPSGRTGLTRIERGALLSLEEMIE
jgi:hypothetical protein